MDGDNPYRFSFNGEVLTIFVGNVHSAGRQDSNEFRIQCPGGLPKKLNDAQVNQDKALILGFSGDLHTFSAWDPVQFIARNTRTQRFSIYTRLSRIQDAAEQGLSRHSDTDGQRVVMFRRDLLGLYVENYTVLHQVSNTGFNRIAKRYGDIKPGKPIIVERQKIEVTSVIYPRNPLFRLAVLGAYAHRCAMCGMQLELVEAAHIVPHSNSQATDEISNGIALCTLHHRSFDKGLLYVREDYSICLNWARVKHLRKVKRSDGLTKYKQSLRSSLILPSEGTWYPSPDNLTLGNNLRGIGIY